MKGIDDRGRELYSLIQISDTLPQSSSLPLRDLALRIINNVPEVNANYLMYRIVIGEKKL